MSRILCIMLSMTLMVLGTTLAAPMDSQWWDVNPTSRVSQVVGQIPVVYTNGIDFTTDEPIIFTNTLMGALVQLAYGIDLTPIELSQENKDKGLTFINSHGEDQNTAIEIGATARAKIPDSYMDGLTQPTVLRSVSIAIGDHADAYVENNKQSQAIAIGWHAQAKKSNAIAIGNGAQHPDESAENETGDATYANGSDAIAMGYSSWSKNSSAIAIGAHTRAYGDHSVAIGAGEGVPSKIIWTNCAAMAYGSVQIGAGTNDVAKSLKFRSYMLVDSRGQIPPERLADALSNMDTNVLGTIERLFRPGNTTIVMDGTSWENPNGQHLQPRLNGISEITMTPGTNDIYLGGTEVDVEPPLGSRNYDLVLNELPELFTISNGVLTNNVPRECILSFANLEEPRPAHVNLACESTIGYSEGLHIVVTNAPCLIRVREPSTNRLVCVVKPWSLFDL